MHIFLQKLIHDVTVSVSSSRLVAAASKSVQSLRSRQDRKTRSVSLVYLLIVLNTGLADFSLYLSVSIN